jgi:CRP-like cAMP-binding protein
MLALDILVNVANVIYLFSYLVRDILWLRILTVLGAFLLLPYYYLQVEPLWPAIAWNLVFSAINIFWIAKLMLERRPVHFTNDEKRLYEIALRNLKKQDAHKLFRLGTWSSAPVGTTFLTQGQPVDCLTLIADGNVSVEIDARLVDTLGEGRFLGATAFLSTGVDFTAPVTVKATEPTRIVAWSFGELETQIAEDVDLKVAIEASLGLELSRFLQTSRTQLLHPGLA